MQNILIVKKKAKYFLKKNIKINQKFSCIIINVEKQNDSLSIITLKINNPKISSKFIIKTAHLIEASKAYLLFEK